MIYCNTSSRSQERGREEEQHKVDQAYDESGLPDFLRFWIATKSVPGALRSMAREHGGTTADWSVALQAVVTRMLQSEAVADEWAASWSSS